MLCSTKNHMFKATEHHMLQIIRYFELTSFELTSFDCIQKCSTLYTGQPEIVTLFS